MKEQELIEVAAKAVRETAENLVRALGGAELETWAFESRVQELLKAAGGHHYFGGSDLELMVRDEAARRGLVVLEAEVSSQP